MADQKVPGKDKIINNLTIQITGRNKAELRAETPVQVAITIGRISEEKEEQDKVIGKPLQSFGKANREHNIEIAMKAMAAECGADIKGKKVIEAMPIIAEAMGITVEELRKIIEKKHGIAIGETNMFTTTKKLKEYQIERQQGEQR